MKGKEAFTWSSADGCVDFQSEFNALLFAFLHLNPELRDAGRYVHEKLIEAYRNDIPELQSRRARKRIVGRAPRESRSSAARRAAAAAENESASVGNSGSASSDESSESASLSPPSTETMA